MAVSSIIINIVNDFNMIRMKKVQNKILITGGAGMIGSNLVKKLVAMGHDVFIADNLWGVN